MAFVYYPESRLVPIFENNPKHNPDSAQTMLSPQAKVETDENQDTYNLALAPYVQVRVVAGTASGVAPGWWPNGWVLRKFLRKCLKQNAASAVTGESFTGVSYGDYKFKSDAASKDASARFVSKREQAYKPPSGPPVYKPGYICNGCGLLTADHRVYETASLRTLTQSIVTAHGAQPGAPMFGILDVRNSDGANRQMIVAESGFNFNFAATVQANAALFPVPHHYVTQGDITAMGNNYVSCTGTAVNATGHKFTCAAIKLVQYYAHNLRAAYAAPVLYLSEVAGISQGIYVQGHTAESCDACRNTVPKMLCGLTNLERQAVNGRYPKRARPLA